MNKIENKMRSTYYPSKIDLWHYIVFGFIFIWAVVILLWVGMEWYIVLILGLVILGIIGTSFFQIHYVIKDDELGVKTQAKWLWYPIDQIKEVRKVKSIMAAPAMSFTRVAIKFERGTSKSAVPLEISPKDREKFIQDLLKINPNIKVI